MRVSSIHCLDRLNQGRPDDAKAFQQGQDAFTCGYECADNPYTPRDPGRMAWAEGFKAQVIASDAGGVYVGQVEPSAGESLAYLASDAFGLALTAWVAIKTLSGKAAAWAVKFFRL